MLQHRRSSRPESKNCILKVGQTKIELLEPTSEDSTIAKFIEKKGEGIHHIAFAVPDVQAALDEAESKRCQADRQSSSWRCRRLEHCIPSPEIDMQRSDRTLHAGKIRNNGQLRIDNRQLVVTVFICRFVRGAGCPLSGRPLSVLFFFPA
mgnify:CR=1 FL=1